MQKIHWGVLSTAKIATQKVVPAMQQGEWCEILGIASRSVASARQVADDLGIERAYGSYEEMLADPDIDAIYNPLPNHLHVPWTIKALQAGKHVLCEKPIALSAAEAEELLQITRQYPNLRVMEAFMYRHHPQWQLAKQHVNEGAIGELKTIQSFFSYFNDDPGNIRNQADIGGGGLMDIGCYNISLSRFIFEAEPEWVMGLIEYDPDFAVDRLASGMLVFGSGTSTFTCSTQLSPYQRVNIFGTQGRIEIEIPFNAPPDKPCRVWHQQGSDLKEIVLEPADQYTIQGDLFSRAILENASVPTPLEDAVANMKVLERIVQSAREGVWL